MPSISRQSICPAVDVVAVTAVTMRGLHTCCVQANGVRSMPGGRRGVQGWLPSGRKPAGHIVSSTSWVGTSAEASLASLPASTTTGWSSEGVRSTVVATSAVMPASATSLGLGDPPPQPASPTRTANQRVASDRPTNFLWFIDHLVRKRWKYVLSSESASSRVYNTRDNSALSVCQEPMILANLKHFVNRAP